MKHKANNLTQFSNGKFANNSGEKINIEQKQKGKQGYPGNKTGLFKNNIGNSVRSLIMI